MARTRPTSQEKPVSLVARYPKQDPRWPSKDHFEPLITEGKFKGAKRCQCWKTDRSAQCTKSAKKSFKSCGSHGSRGGAPVKNGSRSKYIPKGLDAALAELMEDPELTGLRKEIAAVRYRQNHVLDQIRVAESKKLDTKTYWVEWDDLADKATSLTMAENRRQAQLASNMNARQANVLKTVLIAVLTDVIRDESIPRSQIARVVGLKLVQKMS